MDLPFSFFLSVVVSVHSKRLCQRLSNYVISQQSPLLQNVFFQALFHHKKKSRSIIRFNSRVYLNHCHCQLVCVSKSAASNWCPHTRLLPLSLFLAKCQNFRESLFFVNQYFSLFIEWLLHLLSFNIRSHDINFIKQGRGSLFTQSLTKVSFISK